MYILFLFSNKAKIHNIYSSLKLHIILCYLCYLLFIINSSIYSFILLREMCHSVVNLVDLQYFLMEGLLTKNSEKRDNCTFSEHYRADLK